MIHREQTKLVLFQKINRSKRPNRKDLSFQQVIDPIYDFHSTTALPRNNVSTLDDCTRDFSLFSKVIFR